MSTTTIANPARATRWAIDPDASSVAFRARGLGGLPVRGHFGSPITGELATGHGRFCAYGEIEAASVRTGIARRDDHLRSTDFLAVDEHPIIALRVDEVPLRGKGTVTAAVTIRGATRNVPLALTVEQDAEALRGRARGRLNRRDFAVIPPAFLDRFVIKPDIEVELDVVARPL